jgi:hypothetical protein
MFNPKTFCTIERFFILGNAECSISTSRVMYSIEVQGRPLHLTNANLRSKGKDERQIASLSTLPCP